MKYITGLFFSFMGIATLIVLVSIHVEEIGNQPRIQVRPYNLTSTSRMRDLDPGQIETLVAIKVSFSTLIQRR